MIHMTVTHHENPYLRRDGRMENNLKIETENIKAMKFILVN